MKIDSPALANETPRNVVETDPALWSVPRLLGLEDGTDKWIIKGLLKRGSQMLLAAPPKSGKTLLAAEIAIALSKPMSKNEERFLFNAKPAGDFPGLKISAYSPAEKEKEDQKRSYTVLFASLEMGENDIADRLRGQLAAYELPSSHIKKGARIPGKIRFEHLRLVHMFGLPKEGGKVGEFEQDLKIVKVVPGTFDKPAEVKEGAHASLFNRMIQAVRPDVVIFDTLIQLHDVNENDNVLMKEVLRRIRKLTVIKKTVSNGKDLEQVAHIVLHHTRKEGGYIKGPLGPEMMRGAGAIHGVADVVVLARQTNEEGVIEVNVSSRSSNIPNFFLKREKRLVHRWVPPKVKDKANSIPEKKKALFKSVFTKFLVSAGPNGTRVSLAKINKMLKLEAKKVGIGDFTISQPTAKGRLEELCQEKVIVPIFNESKKRRKNAAVSLENCAFKLARSKTRKQAAAGKRKKKI